MKSQNAVKECLICGKQIEMGNRVRIVFMWERSESKYAQYLTRASVSGVVCQECAQEVMDKMGLERPC